MKKATAKMKPNQTQGNELFAGSSSKEYGTALGLILKELDICLSSTSRNPGRSDAANLRLEVGRHYGRNFNRGIDYPFFVKRPLPMHRSVRVEDISRRRLAHDDDV